MPPFDNGPAKGSRAGTGCGPSRSSAQLALLAETGFDAVALSGDLPSEVVVPVDRTRLAAVPQIDAKDADPAFARDVAFLAGLGAGVPSDEDYTRLLRETASFLRALDW